MNWPAIIIVAVLLVALIAFAVWRNIKDEKQLEKELNDDYCKPNAEEADVDIDETTK
jgi:hypothetical protein